MNELAMTWYWIAGERPDWQDRPKGTSSLGVCMVEGVGPMHANARAKQLGIHPGGKFKIWELHGPPPKEFQNRLLSNDEARQANIALKEQRN